MRLLIHQVGDHTAVAEVTITDGRVSLTVAAPRYEKLLQNLFLKPQYTFGDGEPAVEVEGDPEMQRIMPGDPQIIQVLPEHLAPMGLDFVLDEERK